MRISLIRKFARLFLMLACVLAPVLPVAFAALPQQAAQPAPAPPAQQQSPPPVQAPYTGISVEPSQQLFAVMCALDAAGFDSDTSTANEMPERLALREDLLKMTGPATEAVRAFYRDHVLADPGETLSRYITFALVVGPPPTFQFQVAHDLIPPDVLAIEGFREILAAFYHEAHLGLRWISIEPEYNRALARFGPPVRRIVFITNAYLREILKPIAGRSFTVYVEPFVGNLTNFRNTGDRYAIVIGTGSPIPVDDIQHAYLHFVLDPLPLQYRKEVLAKRALLNIAARAPRLPPQYRNDFLAFADECLIKAVELRLRKLSPDQLEAALGAADQSGFILVRPFVKQLRKFEKLEPAMSYYFPDLIAGIDVAAEQKRLLNFTFAPFESPASPDKPSSAGSAPASGLDRMLADGDHEIALQNAPAAVATFEKILKQYPDEPRAVYGLAISSVLAGNAERAKELFEKLVYTPAQDPAESEKLAAPVDPAILSWSHVYLGRIHDLVDDREDALAEYHAALAVVGAPESARVAAQRGLESQYKAPARQDQKEPQKP